MLISKRQIKDEKGHLRNTTIWDIEVDYNNLEDMNLLLQRIKSHIGSLHAEKRGSKNSIKQKKFDACNKIYKTDISSLYNDQVLDLSPVYYVYAHCEPNKIAAGKDGVTSWFATLGIDLIPFYIGKGKGDRANDLNRNETHRKVRQRLREFGQDVQVRIIKDGLTELEALCLESKLIDIFGVIGKGGKLVNVDEGSKSKERQRLYEVALQEINNYYKNSLKVDE
jgi:hypothetical protein